MSVDRDTAPYYVLPSGNGSVSIKEGSFFRDQGGLKHPWGKEWIAVDATSIEHARRIADGMVTKQQDSSRYVVGDWSAERQGFKLLDTQLPIESHVIGYIPIASEAYRVRDTLNRAPSKPQLEAERIENATNVGICAHHGVKTFANAVRIREGIRAGIEAYIRSQPAALSRYEVKAEVDSIRQHMKSLGVTHRSYFESLDRIEAALESTVLTQSAQPSVPVDALKSLERFAHDPPLGEDQWIDAANLDALISVHGGKENG
jgi:hypothetical protein